MNTNEDINSSDLYNSRFRQEQSNVLSERMSSANYQSSINKYGQGVNSSLAEVPLSLMSGVGGATDDYMSSDDENTESARE